MISTFYLKSLIKTRKVNILFIPPFARSSLFHNDKPSVLQYFICNCFVAVVTADHFCICATFFSLLVLVLVSAHYFAALILLILVI